MRRVWADGIGLSSLLLLVTIFFFRLFYPVPSLIVTPDYGRSDAWHFSFATKYVLSESLKSNSLPLWRNDIGDGFPLFAEGQTGALFLPNIVLFRFLPPVIAYNTALMFAVLLMGIGMYVWSRIMKFSVLGSWFVAVSVTFSGLSMTQLTHITLLQGMSMLPVIAALSIAVTTLGPYPWTGFLAFAVATNCGRISSGNIPHVCYFRPVRLVSFYSAKKLEGMRVLDNRNTPGHRRRGGADIAFMGIPKSQHQPRGVYSSCRYDVFHADKTPHQLHDSVCTGQSEIGNLPSVLRI